MQDFSYLTKLANDWKVTSYGDLGAFAGLGGRGAHYKFFSTKLNKSVNTIFMEVGFGIGASAGILEIDKVVSLINNLVKVKDGLTAESNYKQLVCHMAFSIADIIGATGDCESLSFVVGDGPKYVRLCASGNGAGPAGSSLIFTMPTTFLGEKGVGIAAETSVTSGYFLGVGTQFYDYNRQQQYLTEKKVRTKASDPLPLGQFGNMK